MCFSRRNPVLQIECPRTVQYRFHHSLREGVRFLQWPNHLGLSDGLAVPAHDPNDTQFRCSSLVCTFSLSCRTALQQRRPSNCIFRNPSFITFQASRSAIEPSIIDSIALHSADHLKVIISWQWLNACAPIVATKIFTWPLSMSRSGSVLSETSSTLIHSCRSSGWTPLAVSWLCC